MYKKLSTSPEQTFALGASLARVLSPGDVVCLIGDLGAGKTYFVKGIAHQLGISETEVTSPTFTLINEYEGVYPVYHFDVYRLEQAEQLEDLGYEDYFYGDGICIIEWADRIRTYWPAHYLKITIRTLAETTREFEFTAVGLRYQQCLTQLAQEALL